MLKNKFQKHISCISVTSLAILMICFVSTSVYAKGKVYNRDEAVNSALNNWEAVIARHNQYADSRQYTMGVGDHYQDINEDIENDFSNFPEAYSRENNATNHHRKHEFNVSYEISSYVYAEPDVMKIKGIMYGLNANYRYRPDKNSYLVTDAINYYGVDSSYSWGEIDYHSVGQPLSGDKHDDKIIEVRGVLGKEFSYHTEHSALLYSGFGLRYLKDLPQEPFVTAQSQRYLSYQRESTYYYVPLGIKYSTELIKNWDFDFNFEYDVLIRGKQETHASDMNSYASLKSSDSTMDQDHGFGLKGGVEISTKTSKLDFILNPYVEYWDIEGSDSKNLLVLGTRQDMWEPPNFTLEFGLKFGLNF